MRGIPKTNSHRDGGVTPSIKCLRYPGAFGDTGDYGDTGDTNLIIFRRQHHPLTTILCKFVNSNEIKRRATHPGRSSPP